MVNTPTSKEKISSSEMTTKDLLDQLTEKLGVEFDDETNNALENLQKNIKKGDLVGVQKNADVISSALLNLRYSEAGKKLDITDMDLVNEAYEGLQKITEFELKDLKSNIKNGSFDKIMDKIVDYTTKNDKMIIAEGGVFGFLRGLFKKSEKTSSEKKGFFGNMFGKIGGLFKRAGNGIVGGAKGLFWSGLGVLGISKGYPAIKKLMQIKDNPLILIQGILDKVNETIKKLLNSLGIFVPNFLKPEPSINTNDPEPFLTDEKFEELVEEREVGTLVDQENATLLMPDGSTESIYIPGSLKDMEAKELETIKNKLGVRDYHQFLLLGEINDVWTNTVHIAAHENYSSGNDVPVMKGKAGALQHSLMELRNDLLNDGVTASEAKMKLKSEIVKQKKEMLYIEKNIEPVININDVEDIYTLILDYTGTTDDDLQNKKLEIFAAAKKEIVPDSLSIPAGAIDVLNTKLTDDLIQHDSSYTALEQLMSEPTKNEKLMSFIKNSSTSTLTEYVGSELSLSSKVSAKIAKELIEKYGTLESAHNKQRTVVKKEIKLRFKNFTEKDQNKLFVQQYNAQYPDSPITIEDAPFEAALDMITDDQIDLMIGISMITYSKELLLFHMMEEKKASGGLTSPTELMLGDILGVGSDDIADSTWRTSINIAIQLGLTLIPFGVGMTAARLAVGGARMLGVASLLSNMGKFGTIAGIAGRLAIGGAAFHVGSLTASNVLAGKKFEELLDGRDNKQALLMNFSTFGIFKILGPRLQGSGVIASGASKILPNTKIPLSVLNAAPLVLESAAFTGASAAANSRGNPEVTFTEALSWKQFAAGLIMAKVRHTKRLEKGQLNPNLPVPQIILKPVNGVVKLITRTNKKITESLGSIAGKLSGKFGKSMESAISGNKIFTIGGEKFKYVITNNKVNLVKIVGGKNLTISAKELSALVAKNSKLLMSNSGSKAFQKLLASNKSLKSLVNSGLVQPSKITNMAKSLGISAKNATVGDFFKLLGEKKYKELLFGNLYNGLSLRQSIKYPGFVKKGIWVTKNIPLLSAVYGGVVGDNGDAGYDEALENYFLYGILCRSWIGKAAMFVLDKSDVIV